MIFMPTKRAMRSVLMFGPLAAWLAVTGCLGLVRGDYFAGVTNGGLDTCPPFNFDVSVEDGARIRGLAATSYPWGTVSWDVTGVIVEGDIHLETRAADPRAPQQLVRWTGSRRAVSLVVTEETAGQGCSEPRTARLDRK